MPGAYDVHFIILERSRLNPLSLVPVLVPLWHMSIILVQQNNTTHVEVTGANKKVHHRFASLFEPQDVTFISLASHACTPLV
jgi:hypothetical protein